jgi:hypothetical protein
MQGLQLIEVLLCHSVPLVGLRNGVVADQRGEQRVNMISQLEPLLLPFFPQFGHGDVKIRIGALPGLSVDNYSPQNCYFIFGSYKRHTRKK